MGVNRVGWKEVTVLISVVCAVVKAEGLYPWTPLEPQFRFGDKPVNFQVVCPQNGRAVLKGLKATLLQ